MFSFDFGYKSSFNWQTASLCYSCTSILFLNKITLAVKKAIEVIYLVTRATDLIFRKTGSLVHRRTDIYEIFMDCFHYLLCIVSL